MAYWWVNQGKTYKEEKEGSFLWAPIDDGFFHWNNMTYIQEGDIVFSYSKGELKAYSSVVKNAYKEVNPFNKNSELWDKQGNKVDLVFNELQTSIPLTTFNEELKPLLQEQYSPLNRNARVNQGYLFRMTDEAGAFLSDLIEKKEHVEIEDQIERNFQESNVDVTTVESIVNSRKGQGRFREGLKSFWGGCCSLTACDLTELLIASHIKPWKYSNNNERLDTNNGLLLSPTYDKLFDKGYISFYDDGSLIISPLISDLHIKQLGIDINKRLSKKLNEKQCSYLDFHRRHFKNTLFS